MKVLYLCDGMACNRRGLYCRTADGCRHTSDVRHALNGPCANPEENPRFVKVGPYVYVECDEAHRAFITQQWNWAGN